MNTDLETIENYVNGQLSAEDRAQFEATLRTDPALADALAFYVMSKRVAQAQAREQRLREFDALRNKNARIGQRTTGTWILYAAAACIVFLLGLSWYFFSLSTEPAAVASQQVDAYITAQFSQLPTTMDARSDSLKIGVDLFNKGNLGEAATVFGGILAQHPDNDTALKYAGIVSLRQGNYDKAIDQFDRLSQRTDLYANPGLFYKSLTLLKRGRPMDKSQAEKLLRELISRNLEGKREAQELLKTL